MIDEILSPKVTSPSVFCCVYPRWLISMYRISLSLSVCVRLLTAGRATGVCRVVWPELWSPASSCWDPARIQRCCRQTPAPSATHCTHTHIKPSWESQWHVDEAPVKTNTASEPEDLIQDQPGSWNIHQYRHWSRSSKGSGWFDPCISIQNVPKHEINKHFWMTTSNVIRASLENAFPWQLKITLFLVFCKCGGHTQSWYILIFLLSWQGCFNSYLMSLSLVQCILGFPTWPKEKQATNHVTLTRCSELYWHSSSAPILRLTPPTRLGHTQTTGMLGNSHWWGILGHNEKKGREVTVVSPFLMFPKIVYVAKL